MSKYGVICGPYFPVFRLNMEIYGVISGPNTGKNGPEITPHLATSRSVRKLKTSYLVFAAINISEDLAEASLQKCSCKKMFWIYAANLQNTHVELCFATSLKSHFNISVLL